jgi:alkylation response protein AidB-like acyl-CoA dehydrogenase
LQATKNGPDFILNGIKTFCTGSEGSDYLSVAAKKAESDDLLIAVIPTEREGIIVNGDWDSMGQRLTASGSVTFNNVYVKEHEVLNHNDRHETSEFSKVRYGISHFILNQVLLGILEGALKEAKIYTKKKTRPRSEYVEEAVDDPIIQRHYGEFYVQLEAAKLLVEKTDVFFQQLWEKEKNVTVEDRQALDNAVYAAKIFITEAGLDITSRMFTVMGSRATANKYRYDRFWRNMRTMSLLVPVDTIIQQLGDWVLHDKA